MFPELKYFKMSQMIECNKIGKMTDKNIYEVKKGT